MVGQAWATIEHVDDLLIFPPPTADNHQPRNRFSSLLSHGPPDVEQQQVILARIHGADTDEIGRAIIWARRGGTRSWQVRAVNPKMGSCDDELAAFVGEI